MQPPLASYGPLDTLPPSQQTDYVCYVTKRYKYVSLVPRERASGIQRSDLVVTLHQNEARRLAQLLLEAVDASATEDFSTVVIGGTEGLYLGGPPEKAELVEFNPSLLPPGQPR